MTRIHSFYIVICWPYLTFSRNVKRIKNRKIQVVNHAHAIENEINTLLEREYQRWTPVYGEGLSTIIVHGKMKISPGIQLERTESSCSLDLAKQEQNY
jgi:hypothetical protein